MAIERVTAVQRRFVFARAKGFCEYCHTPEGFVPGSFAIEHIIPRSKNGKTVLRNLALSCPACNSHKFDKVWGVDTLSQRRVRLFNPRRQRWASHFEWSDDFTRIVGLTSTGRATVATLQMNDKKMINLRRLLILAELHPPTE